MLACTLSIALILFLYWPHPTAFFLEWTVNFSLEHSLSVLLDTRQGIFGLVRQVREMTISSTAILLTRRYPSPSDCRSGTKRCLTRPCLSESSMTIRSGGLGGQRTHLLLCSLPFDHLNRNLLFVLPFSKEEKLSFKRVRSTNLCFKDVMKNVFLIAIHD